jgi:ankyrin repeat protein
MIASCSRNHEEMAKLLISEGADIDHQGKTGATPLILACSFNRVEMAKLLISEGADINTRGKDGETALIAAGCLSQELVELLLLKGADVNAKKANGTGVFTECMNGVLWKSVTLELAEILLSMGVDIDETHTSGGSQGFTNLTMAVDSNNEEVVRFLIKNGANINIKTRDGDTALSLAVKKGYTNIIEILEANSAK